MPDKFELTTEDETLDRGVKSAKIRLVPDGAKWLIGLEIVSGADENDNCAVLHLKDFPVQVKDPRTEPIRIDIKSDDMDDPRTNLYNFEHNCTEKNRIEIEPATDGQFRVKWSGRGEDFDDRFKIDCLAQEVTTIQYPM